MKLLAKHRVVAIAEAADSALARFLLSLGANVVRSTLADVREALSSADFLIDQVGTQGLAHAGLSQAQIDAINPALIHVSVTPFGSNGPRAHWRGSELVVSAMGGTLRLTGDVDRAPVKEALDACWFHADMVAAAGALAALYERHETKRGQHVDVSVQEVAFSRNVNGVLAWQFDRRQLQRVGGALNYGRAIVRCIWPLADGFCFHTLMTGRFGAPANQGLSDWMDKVGAPNPLRGTDWLKYNRSTLDPNTRTQWEAAIENFFSSRTRAQINDEGRRRGINATVLASPEDVLSDPHLQARDFWDVESKERSLPNPPPLSQRRELGIAAHASDLSPPPVAGGGLGRERVPTRFVTVTCADRKSTDGTLRSPSTSTRKGPLAGVRVLDFSWALVGSITTKVLGDLGAEIIKVESRTRPCLSRIDVQVNASRADSFDDKPWFAHLNTSKQSLALDMKHAASREVIDPLIDWADVVVENFSPGTMHKLGLDYARLAKRKPNIVMVSGSVFGQTGPLAQEWGVDGTGAALSGRTLLTGWPDRAPVIPSAAPYGDVIVPYVMAAAAMAALNHRRSTGTGCHIDASMYEICVQQMADAVAAASRGETLSRTGNRDARVFHQGVYRARGLVGNDDRWVAITLRSEAEWQVLRTHARLGDAATPDERDVLLTAWTLKQDDSAIALQLQSLGIAAGVVQDIEDLMERDEQIAARGALTRLDHPLLGTFGHMRTPISFSTSKVEAFRAPSLGEHSRHIAASICGLAPERITELESLGLFK
jgi:crotonobetainyl-CoA:carnitine CoA-transferase CaiB-like acyl-CoA transferase